MADQHSPSLKVGVAWYSEAEWDRLRQLAADWEMLEETYAEWTRACEDGIPASSWPQDSRRSPSRSMSETCTRGALPGNVLSTQAPGPSLSRTF